MYIKYKHNLILNNICNVVMYRTPIATLGSRISLPSSSWPTVGGLTDGMVGFEEGLCTLARPCLSSSASAYPQRGFILLCSTLWSKLKNINLVLWTSLAFLVKKIKKLNFQIMLELNKNVIGNELNMIRQG